RDSRLDTKDGRSKPALGSAKDPWRVAEAGYHISERTVSRLIARSMRPRSQTWKAFLNNHVTQLVSVDFFTVPTATLRVLFVLVVLVHHCRRVVHFDVTEHPTAGWTRQQ